MDLLHQLLVPALVAFSATTFGIAFRKVFISIWGTLWSLLSGSGIRNKRADQELRETLLQNIVALKDRVEVLETWREESVERVRELEAELAEVKQRYARDVASRDKEIATLRRELAAAHAKLRRLEKQNHDQETK